MKRMLLPLGLIALAPCVLALVSSCGSSEVVCDDNRTCIHDDGGTGADSAAGGSADTTGGGSPGAGESAGASGGAANGGSAATAGDAGLEAGASGAGGRAPCDDACGEATPVCNEIANTCVECVDSASCGAPKPACDAATNTCVECTDNPDCKDTTKPLCDKTADQCVACLQQSDCKNAAASKCAAGSCSPCSGDADCSNIAGKGVCDGGTCVQCTGTKSAACGNDAGTPLVCDSLKRTCTTNKQHSVGTCIACVSDAQCQLGQLCTLEKFGGVDVGYFCFWKKGDTANGAPADCVGNGRPYSGTIANSSSVDGTAGDICTLAVSTCVARNQFRLKDCKSGATGSDALCGAAPPNDAKCDMVTSSTSYLCTMRCLSDLDCPLGVTCNTGALQPYCEL